MKRKECRICQGVCLSHYPYVDLDGKLYERSKSTGKCGDCGITNAYHHASCDQEYCPKCGLQLWFMCECKMGSFYLKEKHEKKSKD